MAIVRAVKSGNWSDTTVWNTGALPTSADDVYSNTFTVTIDISPTVLSISNAAATGVTAGGTFRPSNGITLTLTGAGVVGGSLTAFYSTLSTGQSCAIVGTCVGGSASGAAVENTSTGTINITGNCTGGNSPNAYAVLSGTGASTGIINITGDCTGGSAGGSYAVYNNSTGTINVTGTITGGSHVTAYGAFSNSTGTLRHIGAVQASTTTAGIGLGGVGQVTTLTGPLISTDGSGGTAAASGVNPCVALRWFPADTALSTFEYRMRGQTVSGSPSVRPARQLFLTDAYAAGYPTAANVRSATTYGPGNIYTGTLAVPPAGSVALGVPVDATTGTAVLTQANFQAALDAQGLTSARATKLDSLDATVSSRLATASYTAPPTSTENAQAVRTELAPELGRIDTTVSSRLATTGYTTPPTPVQNATAVRTELTTELTRIDTTVSSRSTFNPLTDAVANVTLVDTTTNLTNPPDVPTTIEIASAVRTELTPELGRIDTDVSSRLASASYTTPPTSIQNAQAVRTELSTELGRIDTSITSRLASVDYTVPPTALQNAEAVETQLSLPLGNLDAAVSTRSTFNSATDAVAHVTLVDTTTDLTNPPVVPTPEQIATAVRSSLEPELERIDVDISTRLAAVDYVEPPTPEENAEAVRNELTPELDRMANCATVATTGQQIQNALSL